MNRLISLDERQKEFRATDCCADNVFLLELILLHHHTRHKSLFIASIDVAKAFDTVAHSAIMQTLGARGCPEPMFDYVRLVYSDATATITSDGWQSHAIHPRHGVRQGDPRFIFNTVMDRLLKSLPEEVGADTDGVKVAIAFADDLVLTATTAAGTAVPAAFEQRWRFPRIMRHVREYGEIFFCVNWNGASAEDDHCRSRHVSLRWPKIGRQEKN